ncbi:hypothetical protein JOM56_012441 [Amanita muscaria]
MDAFTYLPAEIILSVVDNLDDANDIRSLSKTASNTYHTCVPALFSSVHFETYPALEQFLHAVPRSYLRHIQSLDVSTLSSPCPHNPHPLVSLLSSCSRLEKLDLKLEGCPGIEILSVFSPQSGNAFLTTLKHLSLSNCLSEQDSPVSERLAVYIASSLPNLYSLSLSRITRSSMHAQDLVYSYPCIPTVINDDDIPDHPVVGSHLNLPSLLRIASLKRLSIKDTHLGDPEWEGSSLMEEEQVRCELDCLELGGHCLESEYENGMAVMKILNVVGKSVRELSLATALPPLPPSPTLQSSPPSPTSSLFSLASSWDGETPSSVPATPTIITQENGRNITNLHIGPYVSLESLSDTLSHLSSSPIESTSISCFNPDLEDVSKNVEDFLSLRVCRVDPFYASLKHVDVVVVSESGSDSGRDGTKDEGPVRELAEFCWDLGLVCRLRHGASEDDDYHDEDDNNDVRTEEGRVKEWNGCAFLDLKTS